MSLVPVTVLASTVSEPMLRPSSDVSGIVSLAPTDGRVIMVEPIWIAESVDVAFATTAWLAHE